MYCRGLGGTVIALYISGSLFQVLLCFAVEVLCSPKVTAVIIGNSYVQDLGQDSPSSLCSAEDSQESVPQSSALNDFPMNVPFN